LIVVDTNVVAYLLLPGPKTTQAEALFSAHDEPVSSEHVLHLVSNSTCSAYDCEFVAAARQLGVPLVTDDRAILRAFPDLAQPLLE
jgi:predicted nucleic acid-binding protein